MHESQCTILSVMVHIHFTQCMHVVLSRIMAQNEMLRFNFLV